MNIYIKPDEVDFKVNNTVEILGKGGFGSVRKGKYKDRVVAIKTIEGKLDNEWERREPENMLLFVDNDYFPKLFGVVIDDGKYHLVMELAEGGSLWSVIRSQPTTLAQVISWLTQAAKGLTELHSRNLLHRDVKSNNMLLDKELKKLKICDFGFVRMENSEMTANLGTRGYMAPEVFDKVEYTNKCDVYSFGITMWEVLSRKQPFLEYIKYPIGTFMRAIDDGLRPRLEEVRSDCPQSIKDLMVNCWNGSPKNRPTMQEVADVLSAEQYSV